MATERNNHTVLSPIVSKKYRGLLLLVGSFFALIIALAMTTYYLTLQSEKTVTKLDLIAKQNTIAHQLAEDVYNVNIYMQKAMQESGSVSGVNVSELSQTALYRIESLKQQTDALNQIVKAIDGDGDTVKFVDGTVVSIDGIQENDLQPFVKSISDLWSPYTGLLSNFSSETDKGVISAETMQYMVDYTRLYGHKLEFEITNLHRGLSDHISKNADRITSIQLVGALIALGLFVMLIFGVLRRLAYNDRAVEIARRETQEIMQTVNTGLFLLNKDLVIGNQYSNALTDIIGTDNLAGETLSSVLRNRVSDNVLRTAEEFVEQLYNPRVKEKLVDDLNPLHKVLIHDVSQFGESRYLDFKFSRVYDDKEIVRILVNVNDVSEAVKLEQRLEKERAENDLQIEMLTTILGSNPKMIGDFINGVYTRIDKMNAVLKNQGSSQFELENKLKAIYREMHSLKGEASALKLHSFTKIASEAEDKLHALQNQDRLSGNDFLSLAVHLDELLNLSQAIAGLGQRLNEASNQIGSQLAHRTNPNPLPSADSQAPARQSITDKLVARPDAKAELGDYLEQFGRDIATRQGKAVDIDVSQLAGQNIPEELSGVVREICVQLIRNSIVHGIADNDTRVSRGKAYRGKVTVALKEGDQNNCFMFSVEDDGQGIDYDNIRQTLVKKRTHTVEQANALSEPQLLNALFSSGFSTRDYADEDGGRGVGLDLVKERVKAFGGKVSVQSEKGKFTRLIIKLPMPNTN